MSLRTPATGPYGSPPPSRGTHTPRGDERAGVTGPRAELVDQPGLPDAGVTPDEHRRRGPPAARSRAAPSASSSSARPTNSGQDTRWPTPPVSRSVQLGFPRAAAAGATPARTISRAPTGGSAARPGVRSTASWMRPRLPARRDTRRRGLGRGQPADHESDDQQRRDGQRDGGEAHGMRPRAASGGRHGNGGAHGSSPLPPRWPGDPGARSRRGSTLRPNPRRAHRESSLDHAPKIPNPTTWKRQRRAAARLGRSAAVQPGGEGSASDEPQPSEENRRADERGHQRKRQRRAAHGARRKRSGPARRRGKRQRRGATRREEEAQRTSPPIRAAGRRSPSSCRRGPCRRRSCAGRCASGGSRRRRRRSGPSGPG